MVISLGQRQVTLATKQFLESLLVRTGLETYRS